MKTVFLDILDFKDLDAQFLSSDLDLILTVKSPSNRKFQNVKEVGFQQTEMVSTDKKIWVGSAFEFPTIDKKKHDDDFKAFVTNSLSLRKMWLRNYPGTGELPLEPKLGGGKGAYTVYLIGADLLHPSVWKKVIGLI